MDFALGRLSRGDCARTLGGASGFSLTQDGAPTLRVDNARFRKLVSQWGAAIISGVLAPVTTGGPRGFDLMLAGSATGISDQADYWTRGSQGQGAPQSCDGRNSAVSSALTSGQLRVSKGLPMGLSLGAHFGKVRSTRLFTTGLELRIALLEGLRDPPLPDVGLRIAASTLLGEPSLSLLTLGADLTLSRDFAFVSGVHVSPYAAVGVHWIVARSGVVDLTPNIDSTRCAAGVDAVCGAEGLGASAADTAHDRSFADASLHRYRGTLGLWARYELFALAAELGIDLVAPGKADPAAGAKLPRQWSMHVAPGLSF